MDDTPSAARARDLRETIHLQALEAAETITTRAAHMNPKHTQAEGQMLQALAAIITATKPTHPRPIKRGDP